MSKHVWLILAIFGVTFPNFFFMGQYINYGFDPVAAWKLCTINWIAQGVTADLLTMFGFFWIWAGWVLQRKNKLGELWLYVVLAICLGLSFAFPVFMYRHMSADPPAASA